MKQRVVAGVLAAAVLLLLLFEGNEKLILLVILSMSAYSYFEFDQLFFAKPNVSRRIRIILSILATEIAMSQDLALGWVVFWLCFVFSSAYHVFHSGRSGNFPEVTRNYSLELMGYLYVTSLLGFLMPIVTLPHGRKYLLLFFFLVFLGDSAAYLVGTRMGKNSLAIRISPKKSVEGAVAAVIFAVLASAAWLLWIHPGPHTATYMMKLMCFAPLASVLAQLGDLLESVFKRSQSQKDSGSFLPGHGGMLDRIDGFALIAPIYYFFLTFVLMREW